MKIYADTQRNSTLLEGADAIAEQQARQGHCRTGVFVSSTQTAEPLSTRAEEQSSECALPKTRTRVRMAFLLSRYPAVSHTFFLHEVLGLRARNIDIETMSINAADRPIETLPETERKEAERTFYLKGSRVKAVRSLLRTLLIRPQVVMRGMRAWLAVERLTLRERGFWLFYLAEAFVLGQHLKDKQISHLHVHFGGAVASVGMLTAAAWQIPYSLTIHGPEELLNIASYHLREKTRAAQFVLCISDFCRSQLFQLTPPAEWSKFHVIRLGVDLMLHDSPTDTAPSSDVNLPIHIVCTGRLVPAKGHRILLDALADLRRNGIAFTATVVGGGPERANLEDLVNTHGLGNCVRFTSALSHPETLKIVRSADIFALASFAEGVPVAIMEAMSLGIPCVSTTIAGIPELIHSGIDGLLVAPANTPALAAALQALIEDPDLRRRLGYAARRQILSHYNLAQNHELLADFFAQHVLSSETYDTRRYQTS